MKILERDRWLIFLLAFLSLTQSINVIPSLHLFQLSIRNPDIVHSFKSLLGMDLAHSPAWSSSKLTAFPCISLMKNQCNAHTRKLSTGNCLCMASLHSHSFLGLKSSLPSVCNSNIVHLLLPTWPFHLVFKANQKTKAILVPLTRQIASLHQPFQGSTLSRDGNDRWQRLVEFSECSENATLSSNQQIRAG